MREGRDYLPLEINPGSPSVATCMEGVLWAAQRTSGSGRASHTCPFHQPARKARSAEMGAQQLSPLFSDPDLNSSCRAEALESGPKHHLDDKRLIDL